MPLPPRIFPSDVELGKRDDDHKPGSRTPLEMAWKHRSRPHIRSRTVKKVILGLLAGICLYYFYKNMPTDLSNPRPRPRYDGPGDALVPPRSRAPSPQFNPSQASALDGNDPQNLVGHNFNGPIKFYQLAMTLLAMAPVKGSDPINNNVVFAASSLKSASTLLPIACEMAIRERSYIHFAFMGRDDIPMDILKSVNGVSKDCQIIFHDARPDFSLHSSDFRMEVSCSAGLNHINTHVHPQAVIIDGSDDEDAFLITGFRTRATALQLSLIELPENAEQNLMWITQLDSAALSAWTRINIDIIVHAQPHQSGSLIRLLTSLKKADYFHSNPPRLTIELPHDIDEPTKRYLANFKWPPKPTRETGSLLTLHHRIPQHGLTVEENSIRFMEAFWPADPTTAHVLVLSPQAELSPIFYHYLKYTLLEYRYSYNRTEFQKSMLGISLDLPTTYLNDTTEFSPPISPNTSPSPFLWQAPNSNAALYFGEKWVELHDFVARVIFSQHYLPPPAILKSGLVSKTYPSWLELILKLARARGYWTLYPHFEDWDALSTLHTDLYSPPEEYQELEDATDFTADPAKHLSLKHKEKNLLKTSLQSLLSELPGLSEMPMIGWDGEATSIGALQLQAKEYSRVFRREIGACAEGVVEKQRIDMLAGDLFCSGNEPLETPLPPAADVLPASDSAPAPELPVTDFVNTESDVTGGDST